MVNTIKYTKNKDGFFVCPGKDGVCKKDGTFYRTQNRKDFTHHLYRAHNRTKEQKNKASAAKRDHARQKRAKTSLVSNNTLREKEPLLQIEPFNDGDDKDAPSYKEFQPIYDARFASIVENYTPYYASFLVAYFFPPNLDQGVMETYAMACLVGNFTFYPYFGTHRSYGPCEYLDGQSPITESAKLVQMLRDGAVCYVQNYTFKGKTTKENKEDALYWARFWKHVGTMKVRVEKDATTASFEVLNDGLLAKEKDQEELSPGDFDMARKHAAQNRTFLPLPNYLLPQDQHPEFVQYHLK